MAHYVYDENGNPTLVEDNGGFANEKQGGYPSAEKPAAVITPQDNDFAVSKQANYPTVEKQDVASDTNTNTENATPVNNQYTGVEDSMNELRQQIAAEVPAFSNMTKEQQDDFMSVYDPDGAKTYKNALDFYTKQQADYETERANAQEEAAKAKRRARLAGMINLVGGLANVVSAASSRDGRSVVTPNTSAQHEKDYQYEQGKADRAKSNLNVSQNYLRTMQNGFDKMKNNALTYTYKRQAERDKAAREAQAAQDKHDLMAANIEKAKALTEAAKQRQLNAAEKHELQKAQMAINMHNARLRGQGIAFDNVVKQGKTYHKIPYANGTKSIDIPVDKWTPEAIGQAWDHISTELQQDLIEAMQISLATAAQENPTEANVNNYNIFKSNPSKYITANKASMELAIGSALNDERGTELLAYLKNLSNANGGKESLGIRHAKGNEGNNDGRTTLKFKS